MKFTISVASTAKWLMHRNAYPEPIDTMSSSPVQVAS